MKKQICLFLTFILFCLGFLFGTGQKIIAQTTLSLEPATVKGPIGNIVTLDVVVNTNQKLLGADLDLSYDPALLEVQKISGAGFLTNPQVIINRINSQEGKLFLSLFGFPGQSGTGNLATIQLKTLKETNGPTKLSFDPTTVLAASGGEKISFTSSPANLEALSPGKPADQTTTKISPTIPPANLLLPTPLSTKAPTPVSPLAKLIKPLGTILIIAGIGLLILVLTVL